MPFLYSRNSDHDLDFVLASEEYFFIILRHVYDTRYTDWKIRLSAFYYEAVITHCKKI